MLRDIHHLGHAVGDIEATVRFYEENLGAVAGEPEEVPHQGVRVVMLRVGDSRVELLRPTSPDSPVGKFLAKRGEGFHHVAFRVRDIEKALANLESGGVELIDEEPRAGAGDTKTAFVLHPKDARGALVELVEDPR
ncbi:MAG: methylmalonyl-CoA epimerase [Actinomycetota bacterium]